MAKPRASRAERYGGNYEGQKIDGEDADLCGGCGNLFPARLLDAVLLDPEGITASDDGYCQTCHPQFAFIPGDTWRPA